MKLVFLMIIAFLPGAWITLGLPLRGFSFQAKVALACALSPVVIGVEWFILKWIGVRGESISVWIAVINLLALGVVGKRLWSERPPGANWLTGACGGLLFALISSYIILRWAINPLYKTFSWHMLMHTDIVYAVMRAGLLPEEPELAGLALSFGWVPHISIGVLGSLANWAPTLIYPVLNIIALAVTFGLCYELGKNALGLSRPGAFLIAGFLFLGTNILSALIWVMTNDTTSWGYFLGDIRYTPLLSKFEGFETMPAGFALLVGLVFVCLLSMKTSLRYALFLIGALLIGVGVIYPILFPVGGFLVGGLFLLNVWPNGIHKSNLKETLVFLGMMLVSVAVVAAFLMWVTQDRVSASFHFALSGRKAKIFHLLSAFLPYIILITPFGLKSLRKRDRQILLLAATSAFSMLAYIFSDLDNLEYKYVLCATITLAPICAASIDDYLRNSQKIKWALVYLIPIGLIGVYTFHFLQYGVNRPTSLLNAPVISTDSFWIALDPSEADAGWVSAVRDQTPADTMVIVENSKVHLGPFLNRSLYLPSDVDGVETAGYSNDNRGLLVNQRGYSDSLYQARLNTVKTLFSATDPQPLASALESLLAFDRPIAIRFTPDNAADVDWLEAAQIGVEIYADEGNIVWFIPASAELENSLP